MYIYPLHTISLRIKEEEKVRILVCLSVSGGLCDKLEDLGKGFHSVLLAFGNWSVLSCERGKISIF